MIYWEGTPYRIVHTYFKMNSSRMFNKKSSLKIGEWCWFTKEKNMRPFNRLIPPLKATQQIMKWEENHLYYKYDIIRIIWKFWPDNGYG